jgi:hypothetical protein
LNVWSESIEPKTSRVQRSRKVKDWGDNVMELAVTPSEQRFEEHLIPLTEVTQHSVSNGAGDLIICALRMLGGTVKLWASGVDMVRLGRVIENAGGKLCL